MEHCVISVVTQFIVEVYIVRLKRLKLGEGDVREWWDDIDSGETDPGRFLIHNFLCDAHWPDG